MIDYRIADTASSVPEVAPFPAGLNDCVSGLRWVIANAGRLNIDPARVIVAGGSGGGNLTPPPRLQVKQNGDPGLIKGPSPPLPLNQGPWPAPAKPPAPARRWVPDRRVARQECADLGRLRSWPACALLSARPRSSCRACHRSPTR